MTNITFDVTVWCGEHGSKRPMKIGTLAFPHRGMAEHLAQTLSANSTDKHSFHSNVTVGLYLPGFGKVRLDPWSLDDAENALKDARKAWENGE